jgi:hypothetical protein
MDKDTVLGAIAVFAIFALFVGSIIMARAYQCQVRWSESSMESKYRVPVGCMIKSKDRWIPEESYREIAE